MPLNHSSKYSELTAEQYQLIGKIIIEFSNLEYLLGTLLSRLLITSDFLGRTYADQMTAYKMIEAIENSLKIHSYRYGNKIVSKELSDRIQREIYEIKGIKSIRNKFSHYLWMRSHDKEIFGTKLSGKVPNPKKPNEDTYTVTVDELAQEVQKFYEKVEIIEDIIQEIPELKETKELLKYLTKE